MSYGMPPAEPAAAPVCPRHPDRISYVRCQRCGRPTCTECQRPAAVGIHCVDCVRELAAPPARTRYGARAGTSGQPIITWSIIAACGIVYALQWLIPNDEVYQDFAYATALTATEPWRMLTSAFLHSQGFVLHIALNMYTLWIFGRILEPALGRIRYLAVYLISAVGGSVGFFVLTPVSMNGVIGASGAIFGLFGALFVVVRQRGGDVSQLLILIGINAVLGFVIQGIAWQAHLGGFITGGLATAVIAYAPRGRFQLAVQIGGLALVAILLVVLAFARAGTLGGSLPTTAV
ncbi:rhomboid family intramembrane serine protease [Sinomonas sp. JGH33]|uniref:Rhomboid family intramembrane serine protease n=1 Tax=Sinomonas terricola TaxID=3110330 RepID=A0ABU5T7C4_9MICC|nr:rhomboid family intramembrane serine protease [Sinomonas sp. JGH33]MEA5455574.1 rhomboid family intramembrane serine protease [Sinomonas sp. JGH33]